MRIPYRNPALWALLLIGLVTGIFVARVDWEKSLAISPLELIPEDDTSREVAIIRSLADKAQSHVELAVIDTTDGRAGEAAKGFAGVLEKEPALAATRILGEVKGMEGTGRALYEARLPLLFPARFAGARETLKAAGKEPTPENLAALFTGDLDKFLKSDAAYAFDALIPKDPLLLVPRAVAELSKDRVKTGPDRRLVWMRTAGSPLKKEGQQPVFDAIARAEKAMHAAVPGAKLEYTGVNRFAAESASGIQAEMSWLNAGAVVVVGLSALFFLRRLTILLHIAAVCFLSLGVAWTVTLLMFDRVHVLAVVMGSLLCGVAVDYTLHVLLHECDDGVTGFARVRPVLTPLLTGGFIAAGSFAVLLASPLPAIRQIGGYTTAGILGSLVIALLYGSVFRFTPKGARVASAGVGATSPGSKFSFRTPSLLWFIPLVAGALFIRWEDNLNQLSYPLPEVRARDSAIRADFGDTGKTVRIATADTYAATRDKLEAADNFLREKAGPKAALGGPVMMFPTTAGAEAAAKFARENGSVFAEAFRAELLKHDFRPEDFAPFFEAWKTYAGADWSPAAHESMLAGFCEKLTGPEAMLCARDNGVCLMLAWSDAGVAAPELPADTGVFPLRELESLNRVFTTYREGMLHLVLVGFAVIFTGYLLANRTLESARVLAVPIMAVGLVAGVAGWARIPLNMFHMLGAFLALCDAFNYALFAWESRREGHPVPVSVRISWATSAGAFGILIFSSIIALRSLGATVLAISSVTMVLIHFYPRVTVAKSLTANERQ